MERELSAPEELYALVRSIPIGRVAGYGQLGHMLRNPVSGLLVGRWMARCPNSLPWWRVVAGDGSLPVWKKDPHLGVEQTQRLSEEGVEIADGQVLMERYRWSP